MFQRFKRSTFLKNTIWMFFGQGLRILIQAVYFIIIARCLGAEGYGVFVSVVALVAVVAPFSSWGMGNLLVKHVARNKELFRECWGNALLMTLVSGILLTALTWAASQYVLPSFIGPFLIISIAVSDLIFLRVLEISGQAYQAFERLGRTALLQVVLSLARLGGAILLVFSTSVASPDAWATFYYCTTFVSAVVGVLLVNRELGSPKINWRSLFSELKEGFYFSVSSSSVVLYNDTNKILLAQLSTIGATGIYGAASRIIEVALSPIRALMSASYASFFKHGKDGISGSMLLAKRLIPISLVYSVATAIFIYITAPALPWLLGADYENAVAAVRWLAIIPVFKSINSFAQDALTGAGFQGSRSGIQVVAAAFNIVLNMVLIPIYTWKGAAMAAILSDILLTVGYWGAIRYFQQREVNVKIKNSTVNLGDEIANPDHACS